MAVPTVNLRGVVIGSRWPLVLGLTFFSVMAYDVFFRNQYGNLPTSSLTNMATANASGESPDKAGVVCKTSYLGQERCWAGLCKDLHEARKDANDYFESQVLMRVQHRLPMDNETLYDQLQGLKAEALYRFRSQIGIKDVTGHFWDDLELDMGKTILSLLDLNQMVVKENIEEDGHVASLKIERVDCGNITVSQIKVVCLEEQITNKAKESQQREYMEGERRLRERERTRRVNSRAKGIYHQLVETEKKLKLEREASQHHKEMFEKSVKELERMKYEEEKWRELDRERTRRVNGWTTRTYGRLQLKTLELEELQLEQQRVARQPGPIMKAIAVNAFKTLICVALNFVTLFILVSSIPLCVALVKWVSSITLRVRRKKNMEIEVNIYRATMLTLILSSSFLRAIPISSLLSLWSPSEADVWNSGRLN